MTNYKQLCADLIDALDSGIPSARIRNSPLASRARAARAELEPQRRCLYSPAQIAECGGPCQQGPEHCDCGELWVAEPEPEGPTDEEIMALMPQQMHEDLAAAVQAMAEQAGTDSTRAKGMMRIILNGHVVDYARAVLARWGRPAVKPVPVSERPWEREGWCDGDGWCWVWNAGNCQWWEWIDSALISFAQDDYTHSLPHYALPVPTTTQENNQ